MTENNQKKNLEKYLRPQWSWKTVISIISLIILLIVVSVDLEINYINLFTDSFKYFADNNELNKIVAKDISDGKVIGWFQGKMEWGPRALGNRSILGDPRRSDMKDILNLKIKRRESFRPFAPSVLKNFFINGARE